MVDVTSRYQFRAAGLSMVVTPEMRMSACSLPSGGKGLALVAVMSAYAAFAAFAAAAFAAFAAAATVAAAFAAAAAAAAAVVLGVFALLRARCAGEDVAAGIVILWARLVAKGSPVDELLVGDPYRVG